MLRQDGDRSRNAVEKAVGKHNAGQRDAAGEVNLQPCPVPAVPAPGRVQGGSGRAFEAPARPDILPKLLPGHARREEG